MGGLTSPPVVQIGSAPGQSVGPGIAQTNFDSWGASVISGWNPVGAATIAKAAQWDNGFVPALCGAVALNDHFTSQILSTYNTVSVPAAATDRINCFSAYVAAPATGVQSPQARLQFTLTAGPTYSIDFDPRTGVLIAQAGNPLNPQIQRIVLPLYGTTENFVIYRVSFAFNSGGIATGQGWFWPRTDGTAAGSVIFGGTQLEGMVQTPSAFLPGGGAGFNNGTRLTGQAPRQTATPALRYVLNQQAIYNVNPLADQDTWLQCDLLAGNTVDLPLSVALLPDMPTGSKLLITQSPTAIGGITTVQGAANSIIAPGGITASYTSLTFPSTDFPNVTQMLLVKTNVQFQWQILETSAGGSGSGGLFLQAGAGAVARTFQSKGRDIVSVTDFGASPAASAAANTTAFNAALAAAITVTVPAGTYQVTALTFPITRPSYLVGDGPNASIISGSGAIVCEYNNVQNRGSKITGIHIASSAGNTAIKVKNNGLHLENVIADGGAVGILVESMVAANWTNVTANGTAYGVKCDRALAGEVVWLNTFINCSVFTNQASGTYGLFVRDLVSAGSFMQYCTFINFDAEFCGTGIGLIGTAAMNNTFIDTWSERCTDYTINEAATSINNWLYYKVDNTGGSLTAFGTESWRAGGYNGVDQQFFAKNERTDFTGSIKWLGPEIYHQISGAPDVTKFGNSGSAGVYDEYVTRPTAGGYGKLRFTAATFAMMVGFTTPRANNAAALAAGLVAGDLYRTGGDPDLICIVH